jgi:hypothetical protein
MSALSQESHHFIERNDVEFSHRTGAGKLRSNL